MFKRLAILAKELENPLVEVELEARIIIPKPIGFEFTEEEKVTIKYYRSNMLPTLIFRRYDNTKLESKEVVEKVKINNINLVLSIEKSYNNFQIKFPIVPAGERTIYKKVINEYPLVELRKYGNQYSLEVEFNLDNYKLAQDLIKRYNLPYWPIVKPMEISSFNLAKKLSYPDQWCISPKADGEHILHCIDNNDNEVYIHTNGFVSDKNGNEIDNINPSFVYEGELMDDGEILYFDCLIYECNNVSKWDYIRRRKLIKNKKLKRALIFTDFRELKGYLNEVYPYKTDGHIITNLKNRHIVYKSKFINTVDLRYLNGYLLLENELSSERVPKDNIYEFEEEKIYEFDINFNLIKERKDKEIANFRFPYDDNPIYKVVYGIGALSLRVFHNKVKFELLSLLPKTVLLDIGSAKVGDINKWHNLKFKKVYAVDPNLELREHSRNVIEIRDKAVNIPYDIEFDSISILFVPWSNEFIEIIERCNNVIIACMDNPFNYKCNMFTCEIKDNKVSLKIPESSTAENIEEDLVDYSKIFNELVNKGWKIHNLKLYDKIIKLQKEIYNNSEEEVLISMYNYYYLEWKN